MAVVAATLQNVQAIVVGGSVSASAGVAGSAAVNVISDTTLADVSSGANLNESNGTNGNGPGVMVTAADPLVLFSTAGALAAGSDVGVGIAANVDSITKNTQAYIATANVTAAGDVLVQAKSTENINSINGTAVVAINPNPEEGFASLALAGAAGVFVMKLKTEAYLGAGATVTAGGSILVAASEANTVNLLSGSLAAGLAALGAAVTVPVVSKTTEAYVGSDATVTALGLGTAISADTGQFLVTYVPYGSSAAAPAPPSVSANLTGSGNSLTSERLIDQRVATPETTSVHGLAVTAVNSDNIQGVGVDGGVSGGSLNVSGSVAVLTNDTTAYIASGAKINSSNAGAASSQSVLVAAGNDAAFLGVAFAAAYSASGLTPGAVVLVINNTTEASIEDGASVAALGDVDVVAHSSGEILTIAAGVAIGGSELAGSISFVQVNDTTQANIGSSATSQASGAQVNAGGNVLVDATDATVTYMITGSVAFSTGGDAIGAAVSIVDLSKNTSAFIGANATVNALGDTPSISGIFDGNYTSSGAFETLATFHGVAVQASTSENVTNIAAAGAAGGDVALGGGVTVELFNSTTQAYIGTDANVNTGTVQGVDSAIGGSLGVSAAQAVDVAAVNQATNFSFAGGLAAGGAGIAGGVDIGLLNNSTVAYIAAGADVNARQDVDVYALSNDAVQTYVIGAAAGASLALIGAVSVWSIGEAYSPDYTYTDGTGTSAKTKTVASLGNNSGVTTDSTNADEDQTGGTTSMLSEMTDPDLNGGAGNTQYISGTMGSAQSGLNNAVTTDPVASALSSTTAPPQGTVAFIGIPSGANSTGVSPATVNAGGNVNVQAQSAVSYFAVTGGLSVGSVGVGASVEIANIEGSTQAYIDASSVVSAGGNVMVNADLANDTSNGTAFAGTAGDLAAVGAQVVDIQDSSTESASLGSGVTIASAQQLQVTATSNRSLKALAVGGSGSLSYAAGVGVAIANATGGPSASIGSSALIGQTAPVGLVNVAATASDLVMAKAYGVAAGIDGSVTGVYADAVSAPNVTTAVGPSAAITSTGNVQVMAQDTPNADAQAFGVAAAGGVAVGVVISNASSSGTTSSTLGNGVMILAPSLLVQADRSQASSTVPTAQSSATAGAGGVLAGAEATSSTASSSGSVSATTGSGTIIEAALPFYGTLTKGSPTVRGISTTAGLVVGQLVSGPNIPDGATISSITPSTSTTPGSITLSAPATASATGQMLIASGDLGDIAINAVNSSFQSANTTGVAVSGLLAIGLDFAAANSNVTTQAQLGAGVITDVTGTLDVSATGNDNNDASSTAGSGGLIAGDASSGSTTDDSSASAIVDGGVLAAGVVLVTADNNSDYMTDANSVNAAIAGFSGAQATNSDNTTASTTVDSNTAIMASFAVDITAQNTFTENLPTSGSSVSAGSGGVFIGTAAMSQSTLTGNADVTIGSGVTIDVESPTTPSNVVPGIYLIASTILNTDDQVSLSSGGAVDGAGTNSSLTANLNNSVTTDSTKSAPDNFITNENIGIGTYSDVNAANNSEASTFGVLGTLASASATTNVTSNQTVTLGSFTNLTATQNIYLTAGDNPTPGGNIPTTIEGDSNAQSYARGFIGIPVASATTSLTSNATLTVSANDQIESGEDTTVVADHGTPTASATGIGHGYELFFIPVTNGKSSPKTTTSSAVTMDGTIIAGVFHDLDITIPDDNTATSDGNAIFSDTIIANGATNTVSTATAPTSTAATMVMSPTSAAFTAIFDPSFNPFNTIQNAENAGALSDPNEATALEQLVYDGPVGAMVLGPLFAAGGDVTVNAGTLQGSTGTITAYGGPTISITNNSSDYLVLSSITIPDAPGGQVVFTGAATSAPSGLNVTQSDPARAPVVNIQETYNGAVPSTNLSNPGPSVFVTAAMNTDLSVSLDPGGSILNEGGQVSITVADGSLIEAGSLTANQVNITTLKGVTAISNPTGVGGNGAAPTAGWDTEMYWPDGYDPYTDAVQPGQLENIYVAYVANAMFNSDGQYGTDDSDVGTVPSNSDDRGTGTGDLGFTEDLIGTVGQTPPYSFVEPGGPGEPATPQLVDGEPEAGTSLIFLGANVGNPTTYTKADAIADSPINNDFEMNGGNNGYFPLVPVESVGETTASAYPTIGTTEINANAVYVNAMYVDVNEPINVGQPSNWSVNLPASLNSTIQADKNIFNSAIAFKLTAGTNQAAVSAQEIGSLAVGDGVIATGIPSGTTITSIDSSSDTVTLSSNATQSGSQSVSIWEFTLPASAISAGDMPIGAQFDAITNQIVVTDVSANSGGFIELEGAMMSTDTLGEITVNSDLGQVTIDNETSYSMVVNNVAASKSANSTSLSGVDIIDTEQPSATEQTLYVYQPGNVIDEYQGTASQSLLQLQQGSPSAVINGNSTSYSPLAGLRWQWQLQATLSRTVMANVPVNPSTWEETPWIFTSNTVDGESNDNNPWYYLDASGNPTPADSTGTTSTPFGQLVTGSDSDPIFEETISGDVLNWLMGYYVYHNGDYGFAPTDPAVPAPPGDPKAGQLEDPWAYYFATEVQLTLTDSVKADNPIGIDFTGSSQAEVNITSDEPVILAGNITNPLGETTINAPSVTQTSSATIMTNNLTLTTTGGVGTATQPLNASLTPGGVLNVQAGSQGVYLNLGSGALLGIVSSGDSTDSGDVVLSAIGSLDPRPVCRPGRSMSPGITSRSARRPARLARRPRRW